MIPPFQDLMLPIIEMCAAAGTESITNRTFIDELANRFNLTESDRKELLSSGAQSRFENRVYWALVH
jgi:restriction system protein